MDNNFINTIYAIKVFIIAFLVAGALEMYQVKGATLARHIVENRERKCIDMCIDITVTSPYVDSTGGFDFTIQIQLAITW